MAVAQVLRGDPSYDPKYDTYIDSDPTAAAQEFLSRPDILGSGKTNAQAGQDYASKGDWQHPMSGPVPAQGPMLGERRVGKTETVEWQGDQWAPVQHDPNVAPGGSAGYHPGLNTSSGNAMLQGFLSGSAGEVTPGKVGTIAALAGALPSGGASLLPLAAGAAGAMGGAEAVQSHYGTPNAPQSGMEALGGMLEAGAAPIVSGAMAKAPGMLASLPAKVSGAGGAALGGYEGYKTGGIPGAVVGAAGGYAACTKLPWAVRQLGKLVGMGGEEAIGSEVSGAAKAAESDAGGFTGNSSTIGKMPNRPTVPWNPANTRPTEDFWPQGSTIEPGASPSPRDAGWTPTGQSTPAPTVAPPATPVAPRSISEITPVRGTPDFSPVTTSPETPPPSAVNVNGGWAGGPGPGQVAPSTAPMPRTGFQDQSAGSLRGVSSEG